MNEYLTWPNSRYADPVPVAEGIRLGSDNTKEEIGWWTKQWLELVERSNLGIRSERAKYYAALGQIVSLSIMTERVEALVQGSLPQPYRVVIAVPAISSDRWREFLSSCLNFAMSTELFSGKLPRRLAELANDQAGFDIIPGNYGSFHSKCSCPDWSNPCKHIAAVHMLVADEIDRDPFLLLKFRGAEKDLILACIAHRFGMVSGARDNADAASINSHSYKQEAEYEKRGSNELKADYEQPAGGINRCPTPDKFWEGSQTPLSTGFYNSLAVPRGFAPIANNLGRFPLWRSSFDFRETLSEAYRMSSLLGKQTFGLGVPERGR